MINIFLVLVLLIISFFGGIFYQKSGSGVEIELQAKIEQLDKESEALTSRNEELKETLNLVKRQIQTDRIAYQSLQESFESFDAERSELKSQLERQQDLLKQLKKRLEGSLEGSSDQ